MFNPQVLVTVPTKPGVYLWQDQAKRVLYVGKAKNLRARMNQYFSGKTTTYRTHALVQSIASFRYFITPTEKDALLLECDLIKKHKPRFNVLLLDDKNYSYIKIKLLPHNLLVLLTKRVRDDKAYYFGPLPNAYGVRNLHNLLVRLTKFKNGLPYQSKNPMVLREQYKFCRDLLNGNNKKVRRELTKAMRQAAQQQQFELASDYKKILVALDFYLPQSVVAGQQKLNQDVWGVVLTKDCFVITVMFYRKGHLFMASPQVVPGTDRDVLAQFLRLFYKSHVTPDEIVVNKNFITQRDTITKVVNPKQGRKHKMLAVAEANAADNLKRKVANFWKKDQERLQISVKLGALVGCAPPEKIIVVDASFDPNHSPVVGVLAYQGGVGVNTMNRRYKVQNTRKFADPYFVAEGLSKYLRKNSSFKPELVIVDGGVTQVKAAQKVVSELNLTVPVVGLVKDERHLTRGFVNQNGYEVKVQDQFLFTFLARIQTDVDYYARSYHNRVRRILTLEGKLRQIKGVGAKTEQKLLGKFKTYAAVYNASAEELATVVPKFLAKKISKLIKNTNSQNKES